MAGAGLKNFGNEILTSNDVDEYLMQQTVMTFASSAARTTAFTAAGLSPSTGMVSYLTGTNELQVYTGAAWESAYNSSTSLSLRTGGTQRMSIDSSGRMTLGYQPYFFARSSGNPNTTQSPAVVANAVVNTGGHYNAATGLFTAPINGVYYFQFNFFSPINTNGVVGFKVNAGAFEVMEGREGSETYWAPNSLSMVRKMSANDYIGVYVYTGSWHMNDILNSYMGYLIS